MIYRAEEPFEGVPIICEGWAACVSRLPDGRQQVLSFLLPGDLVSSIAIFADTFTFFVETITPIRYAHYDRVDVNAALAANPAVVQAFAIAMLDERLRTDQLLLSLGRRTATERIAQLILNLTDRLARRGLVQGHRIAFPLRQHHIADATGLTPVHVSNVVSKMRRDGLIEISDRFLTVLDPVELRRVAA